MNRKTFRVTADTDSVGKINSFLDIEEIGSGDVEFDLEAKLVHPYKTELSGLIDVDSPVPGSENYARSFSLSTGSVLSLGRWKLSMGRDKLKLVAETNPRKCNECVNLEINAKLVDDQE